MQVEDTQPLDSQVLRDHITRQATESLRNHDADFTGDTRNTYETGEAGHVNLLRGFDNAPNDPCLPLYRNQEIPSTNYDGTNHGEESEDELSSEPPVLRKTSPPTAVSPTTPAIAGHKRFHDGELISSAYKTPVPDYKAFFSARKPKTTVGLSQLFDQTQADTSQMPPDELRSDPVFERPSPEFAAHRKTPGNATMSSPIQRPIGSARTFPDPRSSYKSMEESQKARKEFRKLQKEEDELNAASEDDIGEEDSERRRAERRTRLAQIKRDKQEAKLLFETVKVDRVRGGSSKRRKIQRPKSSTGISKSTPAWASQRGVVTISSDDQKPPGEASSDESIDEYEEYSSSISRKHPKNNENNLRINASPWSGKRVSNEVRPTSSPLPGRAQSSISPSILQSGKPKDSLASSKMPMAPLRERLTSQVPVILNSQEDFQRPQPLEDPSTPTHSSHDHISQSQVATPSTNFQVYSGKTQFESEPETSSAPRAPRHNTAWDKRPRQRSQNARGSSGIPSSPPQLGSYVPREMPDSDAHKDPDQQADDEDTLVAMDGPLDVNGNEFDPTCTTSEDHHGEATGVDSALSKETKQTVSESSLLSRSNDQSRDTSDAHEKATVNKHVQPVTNNLSPTKMALSISNSTGAYATAQTRQTKSPSQNASNQAGSMQTPTRLRPRPFAEINGLAHSPWTPNENGTDVHAENDEERDFNNAVNPSLEDQNKRGKRSKSAKLNHMSPPLPQNSRNTSTHLANGHEEHDTNDPDEPSTSNSVAGRIEPDLPCGVCEDVSRDGPHGSKNTNSEPSIEYPTKVAFNQAKPEAPQIAQRNMTNTSSRRVSAGRHNSPLITTSISSITRTAPQTRRRSLRSAQPIPRIDDGTAPRDDVVAPNRIIAKFRGSYMAFYPATLLGLSKSSKSKYSVRFDDTTTTDLERTLLASLDFNIGDPVKIDRKGLKKTTYQVCGFKSGQIGSNEGEGACTDIYGRDTLIVRPRQRHSLPTGNNDQADASIEVPIWNVYVTENIWIHYARRPSPYLDAFVVDCERQENLAGQQSTSSDSPLIPIKSGLFGNMAFALTFLEEEEASKADVSYTIEKNGGQVIKDKFDSLFDVSIPSTPQEQSFADLQALQPTTAAANIGFVALITDSYSRRIKYIQALALNIPCLHSRWVYDCVARQTVLPWSQYLLPAGQSSILDGAVHSRVLSGSGNPFGSSLTTLFSNMVEYRLRLLNDANVLLVMGANKLDDKRKAFTFLAHAMGAKKIGWVKGVPAAGERLTGHHDWNWILVDETKVKEAKEHLTNEKKNPMQKKGKRKSTGRLVSVGSNATAITGDFKVVGDDHLIQCLISGAPLEECAA